MTILDLLYNLISITSEVTTSSSTVLLPRLQADPAEVILALYTHTLLLQKQNTQE